MGVIGSGFSPLSCSPNGGEAFSSEASRQISSVGFRPTLHHISASVSDATASIPDKLLSIFRPHTKGMEAGTGCDATNSGRDERKGSPVVAAWSVVRKESVPVFQLQAVGTATPDAAAHEDN